MYTKSNSTGYRFNFLDCLMLTIGNCLETILYVLSYERYFESNSENIAAENIFFCVLCYYYS